MAQVQEAQAQGQPGQQKVVEELKVSAHLMTLDKGLFCVFHTPGTQVVDAATGLPGVRVSLPPDATARPEDVTISTFRRDGWLAGDEGAALIRVGAGPARVLITIYQRPGAPEPAPKIQIQQLSDGAAAPASAAAPAAAAATGPSREALASAEISAHIQRRGDVLAKIGEWMGERGSQRWIEGFSIAPRTGAIGKEDIEYQAVLGRGWLSPWAEGGQYCGSRGMALPILGLRVRLKGEKAATHAVRVSASFTDGSSAGPVDGTKTCEAESLAPLEAFLVEFVPLAEEGAAAGKAKAARPAVAAPPPPKAAPAKPGKPQPAPKRK